MHSSRLWQAFGLALLIELVALLCALIWMTKATAPVVQPVVPISIDLLKPDAPPEPEIRQQAAPPKPEPHLPALQAVLPVPRVVQPAMASPQAPAVVAPSETVVVAAVASQSNPSSSAVLANQPVSAATPPLAIVDPAPAYNAKLAAAVQAAFELPAVASALNFKGRTRIEFALHDGLASTIRVIVSSGLGAVDRAAVKAVQAAVFPSPPAALQGKEGGYQIWVACF